MKLLPEPDRHVLRYLHPIQLLSYTTDHLRFPTYASGNRVANRAARQGWHLWLANIARDIQQYAYSRQRDDHRCSTKTDKWQRDARIGNAPRRGPDIDHGLQH